MDSEPTAAVPEPSETSDTPPASATMPEKAADTMPDTDAMPQPPAKPSRVKQIIAAVVTLAVLVLVFAGLFPKFANYSAAWTSIQQMSTSALVVLGIITVINIIVYVWPYQAAILHLRYGPAFVVRQTSFMISGTVPAGGAFGLGVQYAMLHDYHIGAAPATAGIGITTIWNLFVTLGLPVVGLVALAISGTVDSASTTGAIVGVIAIVLMVGAFALVLRKESTARRIGGVADSAVTGAAKLIGRDVHADLAGKLAEFRESTVDVIRPRWAVITGTNVLQQLSQFAVLYAALWALQGGRTVSVAAVLAAFAFARLASFIPVTPGGLGTVDAAMVALLVKAGVPNDTALAANLVWRALSYFPQVFLGIGTFLWWRGVTARRKRAHDAAGAAESAPAA